MRYDNVVGGVLQLEGRKLVRDVCEVRVVLPSQGVVVCQGEEARPAKGVGDVFLGPGDGIVAVVRIDPEIVKEERVWARLVQPHPTNLDGGVANCTLDSSREKSR